MYKWSKIKNVVLQDGINNFNRVNNTDGSGDYAGSEIYKCNVQTSDDLSERKICLLDRNDRNNCPQGWNYSGKFYSENYGGQNINICCKNT